MCMSKQISLKSYLRLFNISQVFPRIVLNTNCWMSTSGRQHKNDSQFKLICSIDSSVWKSSSHQFLQKHACFASSCPSQQFSQRKFWGKFRKSMQGFRWEAERFKRAKLEGHTGDQGKVTILNGTTDIRQRRENKEGQEMTPTTIRCAQEKILNYKSIFSWKVFWYIALYKTTLVPNISAKMWNNRQR